MRYNTSSKPTAPDLTIKPASEKRGQIPRSTRRDHERCKKKRTQGNADSSAANVVMVDVMQ
jgi:hypothetical protein